MFLGHVFRKSSMFGLHGGGLLLYVWELPGYLVVDTLYYIPLKLLTGF